MITAIIFDKDGIIVDTEKYHYEAYRLALLRHGLKLTIDTYRKYGISRDYREFLHDAFGSSLSHGRYREVIENKQMNYNMLTRNKLSHVRGIFGLIKRLHGRYRLAVASSTSFECILNDLTRISMIKKLSNPFEVIMSAKDVMHNKPFPDVYIEVAKRLHADVSECLVIEDSRNGVLAAKSAGMKCIAKSNDNTSDESLKDAGADRIIVKFSELTDELIESP